MSEKVVATADCASIVIVEDNETVVNQTVEISDFSDVHTEIVLRVTFVSVAGLLVAFSASAATAMNRTKNIPKTACILSTSLLWFDCATTFTYALRHLFNDNVILNLITLIGICWGCGSFLNIAVMSLDRLILFQWPYFYVRRFTNGSYVIVYYIIILGFIVGFTCHWMLCFINFSLFWEVRQCMVPLITVYVSASHVASMVISIPCFIWILIIIMKQRRRERAKNESNPTIVVFVCCINYAISTVLVFILLYTVCQISIIVRRSATESLYMCNGFVDTCVYVLWFKECRYELLKMVGKVVPPLRKKVERMRNEIFDVNVGNSAGILATNVP